MLKIIEEIINYIILISAFASMAFLVAWGSMIALYKFDEKGGSDDDV